MLWFIFDLDQVTTVFHLIDISAQIYIVVSSAIFVWCLITTDHVMCDKNRKHYCSLNKKIDVL